MAYTPPPRRQTVLLGLGAIGADAAYAVRAERVIRVELDPSAQNLDVSRISELSTVLLVAPIEMLRQIVHPVVRLRRAAASIVFVPVAETVTEIRGGLQTVAGRRLTRLCDMTVPTLQRDASRVTQLVAVLLEQERVAEDGRGRGLCAAVLFDASDLPELPPYVETALCVASGNRVFAFQERDAIGKAFRRLLPPDRELRFRIVRRSGPEVMGALILPRRSRVARLVSGTDEAEKILSLGLSRSTVHARRREE